MNCVEQDIMSILFVWLERTTLLMEIENFIETEYHKSRYRPHQEQKRAERERLFMPSAKTTNS